MTLVHDFSGELLGQCSFEGCIPPGGSWWMLRPLPACLLPCPGSPLGDLSPSIALARLPIAYGGTTHNQPLFTTSLG